MKKGICCFFVFLFLLTMTVGASGHVSGEPYDSYTYNNDDEPLKIPDPYVTECVLSGSDFGVDNLNNVSDIFYDGDRYLYICDTANNRILVVDKAMQVVSVIGEFLRDGIVDTMNNPTGVYANTESVYIADSKNSRILMFSCHDFTLQKVFKKPNIELLHDETGDYNYIPTKVVADSAGRLYVIAEGVNQGLIRLSSEGEFLSFMGAPSVVPDFAELIWRKFASKEQKARLEKFVPTEYDSLWIDEYGFIYATSRTSAEAPVVRLNSKGEDVLPTVEAYGDFVYKTNSQTENTPYFVDVAVGADGSYFVLDSNCGKIYGYSEEGKFLYAFASNAFQKGAFYSASAIEIIDGKLYVSDRSKGTITIYSLTEFGSAVHRALQCYRDGSYDEAENAWKTVEAQCSNYVLASTGLAQINIQQGNYKEALDSLKSLHDHEYYAFAFEKWRNEFIRKHFSAIVLVVVLGVAAVLLMRIVLKKVPVFKKVSASSLAKNYRYGTYTMMHPFDGFWDIKREGRGDIKAATLILLLFAVLYTLRAQFSGYVVTNIISSEVNGLFECLMILLPILFWIISNWCVTTLMDGKGTMKDIYIASCYALKPYVLFSVPLFILSHVLTANEAVFYQVLDTFCLLWILALLFFGMMTTHDYSLGKGILAALLSVIGICLMIFILLLFTSLIQNVLQFSLDIYKEIALWLYN